MFGESPFRLISGIVFVPSGFVFLLLAGGILLAGFGKRRVGKWVLALGVLFYYLFSLDVTADLMLSPLEAPYRELCLAPTEKIHTVVLLLGGYETDQLRARGFLKLYSQSPLQEKEKLKIFISGMDPFNPDFPEAQKVREFLLDGGIPAREIRLDSHPENTMQSAAGLREEMGKRPFFLLTSAYHMTRSLFAFRALGMNPVPLPADFKTENSRVDWCNFFKEIFPSGRNLWYCDIAVHEYEGLLFYQLRYK